MTQAYEKTMEMKSLEVEEVEQPKAQESKESKGDELLGDLNPRYFEETMSLKEAQEKVHSAKAYSNMSFNTYGF